MAETMAGDIGQTVLVPKRLKERTGERKREGRDETRFAKGQQLVEREPLCFSSIQQSSVDVPWFVLQAVASE